MLFDELYDKPWTRIGPYLIGMFTGWYIHRTKFNIKLSKVRISLLNNTVANKSDLFSHLKLII